MGYPEDERKFIAREESSTALPLMLILFIAQHPTFMICRWPVFFAIYCLSICCDKGQDFPANYEFKRLSISYDYILYETEGVQNFENVPVGAAELNFQRDIQIVRQQSIRNISSQRRSTHPAAGFGERMRKTIVQRFNFNSVKFGFCPICTLDFVTGDRIY